MAAPVNKAKFTQDINAPIKAIYGGGLMFSKDNLSNVISVDIVDGGQPFEVTGTVSGTVIRSDGTTVPVDTGAISGNTVSLTLTEACFDVPGQIVVNIIVTNGDIKCCVLRAVYTVVPTETSAVVDPGEILPSIADLINDIDAAVASIPADYSGLLASIAGTFSASTAYAAGAYVWYDGTLYRFTAAHAAGSWTGSDATVVTIGGEIADLKSALQQTNRDISDIAGSYNNLYNTNDPDILTDKYINPDGTIETISGRTVTGYMPVTAGQKVVLSRLNGSVREEYTWASICFYNSSKAVVSGGAYNTNRLTVPAGAVYARVTFTSTFVNVQIECNSAGSMTAYHAYGKYPLIDDTFASTLYPASSKATLDKIESEVSASSKATLDKIESEVSESFSSIVETVYPRNVYNPNDADVATDTYINPDGTIETISGRTVTGYMHVTAGQKVVLSRLNGSVREEYTWASICFYNSSKAVVSGGAYNTNRLTVPAGAVYARVTFTSTFVNVQIECNSTGSMTAYEEYFDPYKKLADNIEIMEMESADSKPDSFRWHGNLSTGDRKKLPVTNVKNQQVFTFSGNISTFSKLYIGKIFPNSTKYGAFEINSTNVIFYCDNGNSQTIAHGLTIENNIQIELATTNTTNLSKAVLASNGIQFDILDHMTEKRFIGDEGAPYVESDGSTLTDCSFAWTSRNINAPIWLFGDSYMSLYDVRWVYYLVQSGYDKSCIINARAGEGSAEALVSLQNLLKSKSRPKYLVWALGMNDGDANGAVNATWKSCYDEVIELCNSNYITPILATIPNTPTILNTYKNAVVTASGYRYIDFASAVGASEAESGWYSGMLNSDNVHPNIPGAIALYYQALADFPELTSM